MWEKRDIRFFLIKKFIMTMIYIAIAEIAINIMVSYVIFPLLERLIGGPFFESFTSGSRSLGVVYTMLFWLIVEMVLSVFPQITSQSVHHFLNANFRGNIPQTIGKILNGREEDILSLYYVGCIVILSVLLLIMLLPYIIGALKFSGIIRTEMQKIVDDERQQHREYEKSRSLMLSDIAHDLKTPITTVQGYAQALRDGVVTDEAKKQQYLHAICNKSQRLDELLSLLFEYVKIDSEGFMLHKERTDVAEFLRENVAQYYLDFERRGIEMELDIPEECIFWEIDRIYFSRALANLFTNELRHVERGERVLIRLRWNQDFERLSILFGDTGVQIADEVAKHIFEPFVMGDASRSTKGGSGLGLSISSKIIKMHGGRLFLDRNETQEYTKAFVIVLR